MLIINVSIDFHHVILHVEVQEIHIFFLKKNLMMRPC